MNEHNILKWHVRRLDDKQDRELAKYAKSYKNGDVVIIDGIIGIKLVKFLPSNEWEKYIDSYGGLHGLNILAKNDYPLDKTINRIFTVPEATTITFKADEVKKALRKVKSENATINLLQGEARIEDFKDSNVFTSLSDCSISEGADVLIHFSKQRMRQLMTLAHQLKEDTVTLTVVGSLRPMYFNIGKHVASLAPVRRDKP